MMTNAEIVKEYREAKYKSAQIRILADLNCTSADHIKEILLEAGEELPSKRGPKPGTMPKKKGPNEASIERAKKAAGKKPVVKPKAENVEPLEKPAEEPIEEPMEDPEEEPVPECKPKKLIGVPESVINTLTTELKKLEAQIDDIQKKKKEIIDFLMQVDW